MKGSFKFVLRGSSDLAYKWVKEKRNSPNQSLNGGVSVYAIGEYFYNQFYLNKISNFSSANEITKLLKDNNDKKEFVTFGEEWIIPFSYDEIKIQKGNAGGFSDISSLLGKEIIYQDKKLSDILSHNEIMGFAINSYHIFYDVEDAKEGLSFDEIMAHPKLFFKNNNELVFILPKGIKVDVKEVIKSTEQSVSNLQTGTQKVEVNKKTIVLDPGHGGQWDKDLSKTGDPGSLSSDKKDCEAKIVYSIATKLKTKLERDNYKVLLTRNNDYLPIPKGYVLDSRDGKRKESLKYRPKFAKSNDASMFISLHLNANSSDKSNGFEVHYWDAQKTNSKKLAEKLLDSNTLFTRRKITISNFAVIKEWSALTNNPGCLVEIGFITNADDLKILKEKQDDIVNNLYEGIKNYYEN